MAATVIWTLARRRDPVLSNALLVTATCVAPPDPFSADTVVFGWVRVLVIDRSDNDGSDHAVMPAVPALRVMAGLMGSIARRPVCRTVPIAFAARPCPEAEVVRRGRKPLESADLVPPVPGAISARNAGHSLAES